SGSHRAWASARNLDDDLSLSATAARHSHRAQSCAERGEGSQDQMTTMWGIPENVVYATAGIYGFLIFASLIVLALEWKGPEGKYQELADRTRSWWWMIAAFTFATLVSRTVSIVFLGFISFLALKEYLSLIPTRRIDRGVLFFAYLSIPIHYYWAAIGWYGMFIVFIPVWMFLFFAAVMTLKGETSG